MTEHVRVLIVEDRPADAELMLHELRQAGFEPDWERVDTEPDYVAALQTAADGDLDLILSDYTMPQFNALEALHLLQARGLDIPFIVVTGSISEEVAVECMKQGAADYLLKDRLTRLGPAVTNALEEKRLHAEKRQAEQAQRESEQRYRSLFENMPIGLYRTMPDGRILHANPALVEMLGYPDLKSLMATNAAAIHLDPANRDRELDLLEREGDVRRFETQMRRYDGVVIWMRDIIRGIRDTDGRVLYYEGSLEDVTDSKLAEEALRQYAERLRTLHAIDGAILAAWSAEEIARAALRHLHKLVTYGRGSVTRFDWERREAVVLAAHGDVGAATEVAERRPLDASVVERLRQGQVHVVKEIQDSLQTSSVEQMLYAEGMRSYVILPLIAQGKLLGSLNLGAERCGAFVLEDVNIAREVADQIALGLHQAQLREALQTEQQRLEALVEHLPEGILLLDGERRILLANPAAQAALPVLTDAATGEELIHLGDRPIEEFLTLSPEEPWHELEVSGPSHQVFEVAARFVEAGLEARGWALVVRDVTQEREMEQRVQQQERLAAVGQLAGGIAHDFNNLLTTIMLYAQMGLGKKGDLTPDLTRAFETILDESRQAARLVQQVLDFSRRSPMETHPVDLKSFIKEMVRVLQRTIPENISLVLEAEKDVAPLTVDADPTRIQQVLMNLAVNARDAMPGGGVLSIALSREEVRLDAEPPVAGVELGEWICLAVADTGSGIPPDALPHIFEPFFTTKEPGKGTGLGLAQVYGIVTQHGGHIGVETELGQGTTFRVYLPVCQPREDDIAQEEAAAVTPGKGETILLVEDNERIRKAGLAILESLGYQVLTAANGREALGVYQEAERARLEQRGGIDLVLTDLVMPEVGGLELIRELRKANPALKALGITGYALVEDLLELREEGILDIVYKPFDVSALARVIRQVLDSR